MVSPAASDTNQNYHIDVSAQPIYRRSDDPSTPAPSSVLFYCNVVLTYYSDKPEGTIPRSIRAIDEWQQFHHSIEDFTSDDGSPYYSHTWGLIFSMISSMESRFPFKKLRWKNAKNSGEIQSSYDMISKFLEITHCGINQNLEKLGTRKVHMMLKFEKKVILSNYEYLAKIKAKNFDEQYFLSKA